MARLANYMGAVLAAAVQGAYDATVEAVEGRLEAAAQQRAARLAKERAEDKAQERLDGVGQVDLEEIRRQKEKKCTCNAKVSSRDCTLYIF